MRLSDITICALMVMPLAAVGCPGDDTGDSGTTTTGEDTTTSDDTTTTSDDTTTTTSDDTTTTSETGMGGACQEPQDIPESPFDCSGVEGVYDGNVFIDPDDPMGVDPMVLDGMAEVTGALRVNGTDLTDLNFMGCVRSVGADLTIFGNANLTDISGLYSIESVAADIVFSQNDAVTVFDTLPNLAAAERNLVIRNNAGLTEISGFHSLVGIEQNLTIQGNDVLTNMDGLGGLTLVNGILSITNNPMLCQSSVDCVGEGITIPAVPPDEWSTTANDNSC